MSNVDRMKDSRTVDEERGRGIMNYLSRGPTAWGDSCPRERWHSEDVTDTDRDDSRTFCETWFHVFPGCLDLGSLPQTARYAKRTYVLSVFFLRSRGF